MIDVDGSFGEGGGQVLRTSVALASVLGKDVRIFNIRAGRSRPGIRAQHLTGLNAVSTLCDARMEGADIGSTDLVYRPSRRGSGEFRFEIGTAGSVTLVLQTLMPILAFCPGQVEINLTGGTDVRWSPPVDYVRTVTLPILGRMGFLGRLELLRRGHYPRGGGELRFLSTPSNGLRLLNARRQGRVAHVDGVSHAVGLPGHVAQRQADAARKQLLENGLPPPEVVVSFSRADEDTSQGSGLVLVATGEDGSILGADSLGERGKPAEVVGVEAAGRLVEEVESGSFLDRHMGDMVIPFLALAEGESEVTVSRITKHLLTNARVAELVAGVRFHISGGLGEPGLVRVEGLGLRPLAEFSSSTPATPSRP